MIRCTCEHISHTAMCGEEVQIEVWTIYGRVEICEACHSEHPIPEELLEYGGEECR